MSNEINFFTIDAGEIYDLIILALEQKVGEPLYPGDERRLFGEADAAVWAALYNALNDSARQSLRRYARGTALDAIGERTDTVRLSPTAANTKLRFAVAQALGQNVIIPTRTRATADSTYYFATTEPAVLYAGALYVDVPAEATEGGTACNGYKVGTVRTLVDLIPYITSVQNTTETSGGDDGEPYTEEGDNRYRDRIGLAPASFSTAGPEAAYRYYAMSADPGIVDAKPVSDQEGGTINLVVLMSNGGGPNEDVAAKVLKACNASKVRPLNDRVTVDSPSFADYDIEIKYYVTTETRAAAVQAIEGEDGALARYVEWQGGVLGRDINPDKLRALVLCPNWEDGLTGALRVDIVSPHYMELGEREVARFSGVATVTHEVVKE